MEDDIISSLVARQPEKASPSPEKLFAAPKAETIVLLLTSFTMNEQTQRSAVWYYTQCVCREPTGVGSYNWVSLSVGSRAVYTAVFTVLLQMAQAWKQSPPLPSFPNVSGVWVMPWFRRVSEAQSNSRQFRQSY